MQDGNQLTIPTAILSAGLVVAGAIVLTQRPPAAAPSVSSDTVSARDISIELNGWPSLGDPGAPVIIVEYSDYACPFCTRFVQNVFPSIKRDYIDAGLVRFVYKDFAVVGGDRAAEAAHCAAEQGSYWKYHDLLFARHAADRARWSDVEVHRGYAAELGLNIEVFTECFKSRRYEQKVASSTQEAIQNGADGTPHFFINNIPLSGAQPYPVFKNVISIALDDA